MFLRKKKKKNKAGSSYQRYYTKKQDVESGIIRQYKNLSDATKKAVLSVLFIAVGALLLLSLMNLAGRAGEYISYYSAIATGVGRWYVPFIFILIGAFCIKPSKSHVRGVTIIGGIVFLVSLNSLIHIARYNDALWEAARLGLGGGYLGLTLSYVTYQVFGYWAGIVILFSISIISFFIFLNTSFDDIFSKGARVKSSIFGLFVKRVSEDDESEEAPDEDAAGEEIYFNKKDISEDAEDSESEEAPDSESSEKEAPSVKRRRMPKIDLPIHLLSKQSGKAKGGDLEANQERIQKALEKFNIDVEMGSVTVGPTVTQYTLKPAEGIKLSKIVGLGDNLAMTLSAHPVRIEAPIPNSSLVGIEVPNKSSATVPLRDVMESVEFKKRSSNLMLSLGKDVKGDVWLADLQRMPHLLIAGSTGSGKSVCVNSMILSLLYQNGPDDLRFIFVDPKRVELPVYNGIPHLVTPVITDAKKTISALRWAVAEMDKRFDMLSQHHTRDILSYNNKVEEKLPFIVIVIDELADLMVAARGDIENLIVRLAQMSRAVGIHLILATQRPSVNVITGLIKANIPARIAFSVASLVDSRTILDSSGAEKLLGRGDMLFLSQEMSKPKRLQGAFSSSADIKNVVDFLKENTEPDYNDDVLESSGGESHGIASTFDDDGDPLLHEAKKVVMQAKKASASYLQRRLRVGYSRAARLLDLLEEQGIIGPGEGSKPREVLVVDEYEEDGFENEAEGSEDQTESDTEDDVEEEEEIRYNG